MMQIPIFTTLLGLALVSPVRVQAQSQLPTWLKASPRLSTSYPIFVVGGVGLAAYDRFEINLGIGSTPPDYYRTIGKATANATGSAADEQMIEDAFQRNSVFRLGGKFYFGTVRTGFTAGLGTSRIQSRGQTGVDSMLGPSSGRDFALLKNVLSLAGRPSTIDINTTIDVYDISAGYRWEIATSLTLDLELGYTRAYVADLRLNTGASNYENSQYGQNQLRGTESDLEKKILDHATSPTLGLAFSYLF